MSSLDDYARSLPDGTRSFPECQVKADAFEIIARRTEEAAPEAYRALRGEWVPHGPSPSGWIPEAYANCLTLLFRERVFHDEASCLAAFRQNNMKLFSKPVYRIVMFVLSPTLAVMGAEKRWGTFRKGSKLSATQLRKDGPDRRAALIQLEYPAGLHTDFHLKMIATGIESAARAAGASDIQMPLSPQTVPGHAVWDLRYA